MNIIKRNGKEVLFDKNKIINAVKKANAEEKEIHQLNNAQINAIADNIEDQLKNFKYSANVEQIQDLVEVQIMQMRGYEVAQKYVRYRYKRNLDRQSNTTDGPILTLLDLENEEIKQENSNKNPIIASTQRDYMAGEVSKDITKRLLLPKDIWEAHENGIIHFHDADYFAQKIHNCFTPGTKFRTTSGVKFFRDFNDGDKVTVYDKDGIEREATVRLYGKQYMNIVHLVHESGDTHKVLCTANHRWILSDGNVTTSLKEKDRLYPDGKWKVEMIELFYGNEMDAYCVEEPVTNSFQLEKGIVTGNCCLINLEDMLQNGTVISETMIDPPKSFGVAATVTSQIAAQVASSQYGGQSITLAHLAPFVDISRQKIRKQVKKEHEDEGIEISEEQINRIAEKRLRREVSTGIQTIQYQLITIQTTNGQAPFITLFMYLDEVEDGQLRDDLALIIEEVLIQRILGVKNEKGVYITPAFPKLIYVLDEDNITEDSKYWYLTVLAAKCTAKRMVPDYVSAKKEKELKKGNIYPPMGCVIGEETTLCKFNGGPVHCWDFASLWISMIPYFTFRPQPGNPDCLYMDVDGLEIWDTNEKKFVKVSRIVKNAPGKLDLLKVTLSNKRTITCTMDHPFETENRGEVSAEDLQLNDEILVNNGIPLEEGFYIDDKQITNLAKEFDKKPISRYIPEIVFSFDKESRMKYLNEILSEHALIKVNNGEYEIEMCRRSRAMDLMYLALSVGRNARVETLNSFDSIVYISKDISKETTSIASVIKIEHVDGTTEPTYDVTTESEHFEVSGIYSHNCRSFLTPDRSYLKGNLANAKNFKEGKPKFYGRSTNLELGRR